MDETPEIELGGAAATATNNSASHDDSATISPAPGSPPNSGKREQPDPAGAGAGGTAPPTKRARTGGADAGRQRRLFGVLTKTLNRFQEDTKKETEASKRRAAVEERLAAKLKEENEAVEQKSGKEKARRNLRFDIIKKEDERSAFMAIYHTRRQTKLSLANFLCTKFDTPSSSSSQQLGSLKPPPLPELPHALPSTSAAASAVKPLYYLPYKLLPWQADKIDGQVEDMREELDKEEVAWKEEVQKRDTEISDMKTKLDEMNAAVARENGQEPKRTRGRSESRDREDRMREDDNNDRETTSLPGRAPLPEREEMEDDRGLGVETYGEDTAMSGAAEGEDVLEY